MSSEITFAVQGDVDELQLNPADISDQGILLSIEASKTFLSLKRHKEPGWAADLKGTVYAHRAFPCTYEQSQYIEGIIRRRVVPHKDSKLTTPMSTKSGAEIVSLDGEIPRDQPIWFEWLSTDVKDLVESSIEALSSDVRRFVGILRWQQASGLTPPKNLFPYWSIDSGQTFHHLPQPGYKHTFRSNTITYWDADAQQEFSRQWSKHGSNEPLCHILLSEAEGVRQSSSRAALMLCLVSLETGLKYHISELYPIAEWLTYNLPAPPIHKIIGKYIPIIHPDLFSKVDKESFFKLNKFFQELVEQRNLAVHRGIESEYITDITIGKFRSFLYLLDYLRGETWAASHVGSDLLKIR